MVMSLRICALFPCCCCILILGGGEKMNEDLKANIDGLNNRIALLKDYL